MSPRRLEAVLSGAVLAVVVAFVVVNLRPGTWFLETTPTGGDLGAHVWAPAYLRDVLLGEFRLTGWTHDWYAGFPAFTFYMVLPSLLVVVVDAGLALPVSLFAHLAAVGTAFGVVRLGAVRRWWAGAAVRRRALALGMLAAAAVACVQLAGLLDGRVIGLGPFGEVHYEQVQVERALAALLLPAAAARWSWTALRPRAGLRLPAAAGAALLALLAVPMPYGVSLKLVVIAGVVALPAAVWCMARTAGVSGTGRALAAAATLLFLFDRSFNIYGGNLMSTMAGEFAYSLGLAGAVVYIGVAARGMDSGRHRALAGTLLALTGLLHLFSAFFALAATAALLVVLPWRWAAWRARLGWTAVTGVLAAALSAWWVLPFWWNRGLLNDMGWGKERRYVSALWSRSEFDYDFLVNDPPLQPFVVSAAAGVLVFAAVRLRQAWRSRPGETPTPGRRPIRLGIRLWRSRASRPIRLGHRLWMALVLTAAIFAVAFRFLPEGRLWNVRILPFYYLTVYLAAALGVAELLRWTARALDRRRADRLAADRPVGDRLAADQPRRSRTPSGSLVGAGATVVAVAAVLVAVGLPLRSLPGGGLDADGVYRWGPFSAAGQNLGTYWVQYNFKGYEDRGPTDAGGGYSEYRDFVGLMAEVGETRGCGPSLWEYEKDRLGSYGTPMAPMLLPYWTDRCIGSMEGLYFEASATVPYHFLMQAELSAAPSRAQRELPYSGLDMAAGVEHMRMMGVRYYMAFSDRAVSEARAEPGLAEVAASGPWTVFEVHGSRTVVGLDRLPVVADGIGDVGDDWMVPSVAAFLVGEEGPLLAADGPDDWPRMALPDVAEHVGESGDDLDRPDRMRWLSAALGAAAPREMVEPAEVRDVVRGEHSVSFTVDRVGSPVLVRTSYFPNWSVSGADGPYRVTPNFMVVVPTSTEVRLAYGRTAVQWLAAAATLAGLVAAVWLTARSGRAAAADAEAAGSRDESAWARPPAGEAADSRDESAWARPPAGEASPGPTQP